MIVIFFMRGLSDGFDFGEVVLFRVFFFCRYLFVGIIIKLVDIFDEFWKLRF